MDFPLVLDFGLAISKGESLFSQGKVTISKFQGFLSEMYIYHQPTPLEFSWNSPILMKGGRERLTYMSPTNLPRSDLGT